MHDRVGSGRKGQGCVHLRLVLNNGPTSRGPTSRAARLRHGPTSPADRVLLIPHGHGRGVQTLANSQIFITFYISLSVQPSLCIPTVQQPLNTRPHSKSYTCRCRILGDRVQRISQLPDLNAHGPPITICPPVAACCRQGSSIGS